MEAHAEKSRKIQTRAQLEFETIITEETEKAQLQAVGDLFFFFKRRKEFTCWNAAFLKL